MFTIRPEEEVKEAENILVRDVDEAGEGKTISQCVARGLNPFVVVGLIGDQINMGPGNCIINGPTTMKKLDCNENVSQTGETFLNPKRGIGTSLWQVHGDRVGRMDTSTEVV